MSNTTTVTASTTTAIDLTQLTPPTIIEALDYETILEQLLSDFQTRYPQFNAVLESEPVIKLLEVFAYRELLLRARVNDAAKAVMLAYAQASDLDQIAANVGVKRACMDEGNPQAIPPIPATFEVDESLRARTQMAPEGWSTAGSSGAYIFYALSAHAQVKDVSVTSPSPGIVQVTILTHSGTGAASDEILQAVNTALNDEKIRPLTDCVKVQSALIIPFDVKAQLILQTGPSAGLVMQESQQRLTAYFAQQHRLGACVSRSGIFAALHGVGVERVELKSPRHDIKAKSEQAPYCSSIKITSS